VGRIQQPVIFPVLERRGKIKQVEGISQIFQSVVEISGILRIIANKNMVQLTAGGMKKNGRGHKLGGTAPEVFQPDLLGLGK
jgi:hypothetical protein